MCTVHQLAKDIDCREEQIEELERMILKDLKELKEKVSKEEWERSSWKDTYKRLSDYYEDEGD